MQACAGKWRVIEMTAGMSIPYPPDAFLAELGRLVALSSRLELEFDMLFVSEVIFRGRHSGRVEEIRASNLMGMPLDKRIALIRKVFEADQAKSKLSFAELEPTLNRYAAARTARNRFSHGQLTLVMDKEGRIDPEAAQLMYKSWKAKAAHVAPDGDPLCFAQLLSSSAGHIDRDRFAVCAWKQFDDVPIAGNPPARLGAKTASSSAPMLSPRRSMAIGFAARPSMKVDRSLARTRRRFPILMERSRPVRISSKTDVRPSRVSRTRSWIDSSLVSFMSVRLAFG